MANRPQEVIDAIALQLGVIRQAAGYNTNAGAKIYKQDTQRSSMERPSIAIGANSGALDRTGEDARISPRARQMSLTIEFALPSKPEFSQAEALNALEDFERAWAAQTCGAPSGLTGIRVNGWSILDRPEGIDAVVLQITGSADYVRSAQ